MLILVRQRDEDIYISTPQRRITVRILGVQTAFEGEPVNPRVRLGIDAPQSFNVVRGELVGNNGSVAVSESNGSDRPEAD